jgi:hypothetical protein
VRLAQVGRELIRELVESIGDGQRDQRPRLEAQDASQRFRQHDLEIAVVGGVGLGLAHRVRGVRVVCSNADEPIAHLDEHLPDGFLGDADARLRPGILLQQVQALLVREIGSLDRRDAFDERNRAAGVGQVERIAADQTEEAEQLADGQLQTTRKRDVAV